MRAPALLAIVASCGICGVRGDAQTTTRRVIHVSAERFAFTPSEIVVSAGEPVELRIASDDTAHGFRIAGTSINVVIPKRGRPELVVPLQVDTAGRYPFECTRMCGAGHNFMRGVLIVRDPSARVTP